MNMTVMILVLIGLASALFIALRIWKSFEKVDCGSCCNSCKSNCKK